jgi:hypothetical protein
MDGAAVSRTIRSVARPILEDHGFETFTTRSAWRQRDRVIDVVNFQSFNRYNADVLGCTTFSFAINLGIYLTDVPSDYPLSIRRGERRPEEFHCHIRRRVHPPHPALPGAEYVWSIDELGRNHEETVHAAALELLRRAIPWFIAFRDTPTVLSMLLDEASTPDEYTRLPGRSGSPARNIAIGYLGRALGDGPVAGEYLHRALEQLRSFDAKHQGKLYKMNRMVPRHLEETVAALDRRSAP